MSNSENILSGQTHPGDSSPQVVVGTPYKGDGFYGRSDGIHTVQYSVDGFIGVVEVQATLEVNPLEEDWFTVPDTAHTSLSEDSTAVERDGSYIKNFTGNYIWIRAQIRNWTDGTVTSVLLNH